MLPWRWAAPLSRGTLASSTQAFYQGSTREPGPVKKVLRKWGQPQLPRGDDVDTHFSPSYNPWDLRFCAVPDGDLFKAISSGAASVVTDHVDTFTETGIRLRSGEELEADKIGRAHV